MGKKGRWCLSKALRKVASRANLRAVKHNQYYLTERRSRRDGAVASVISLIILRYTNIS